MKNKLGNFLEVFGIIILIASIVGFVILLLGNSLLLGILVLVFGICALVFSLAISQILFSCSNMEEEVKTMGQRMEVLEQLNRDAVKKDLFKSAPVKSNVKSSTNVVNQVKVNNTKNDAVSDKIATCYKCGHKGPFYGGNFCPKCGNHSYYVD